MIWYKHNVILHQTSKMNCMEEYKTIALTLDMSMYMMPHQISGLRTGYYELNKLLSGWQSSKYVIVGYDNSVDANEFISNNASASNRIGSKIAIISFNKTTSYSIVDHKKSIVLYDCDSIFDLRRKARFLVREEGIKALIVDDITKINWEGLKYRSKKNAYYHISRSLCVLCRELRIPII